jgi:hypothetical protein
MPATEQAEGLTEKNRDVLEHTMLAAGQVTDSSTGAEWPLEVKMGEPLPCEMRFDRALVFDEPMLESISIEIDQTSWFDGIDFASLDQDAVHERITKNLWSSLKASIPDWELGS